MTNISKSSGKAKSPWVRATLQPWGAAEPPRAGCPAGLSHRCHERLSHQTWRLRNSQPDLLWQLLGPAHSPGSVPGSAGRVAHNGSTRISAPRAQGTMARVSLGGSSCCTRPQPPSEHSPSCSLWPGKRWSSRYFLPSAAIPAWPPPPRDALLQPWVPGTPKGSDTSWGQSRDRQRLLSLGRQVALLQRDTSSTPPAVHILLETISLLWFQVPAKTRLKNVQNAVFASFPLCVSQRVLQTEHFLIVLLWLSRSGIRESLLF